MVISQCPLGQGTDRKPSPPLGDRGSGGGLWGAGLGAAELNPLGQAFEPGGHATLERPFRSQGPRVTTLMTSPQERKSESATREGGALTESRHFGGGRDRKAHQAQGLHFTAAATEAAADGKTFPGLLNESNVLCSTWEGLSPECCRFQEHQGAKGKMRSSA